MNSYNKYMEDEWQEYVANASGVSIKDMILVEEDEMKVYELELERLECLSDKEFKRDYQEFSCREALAQFRVDNLNHELKSKAQREAILNNIPEEIFFAEGTEGIEAAYAEALDKIKAQDRKNTPVFSGVLNYFPDAINELARCSFAGQQQHAPDEPLQWHRDKSGDELDALTRHLLQAGTMDTDGVRHSTKVLWRAAANLQKELELAGEAPLSKYNKL